MTFCAYWLFLSCCAEMSRALCLTSPAESHSPASTFFFSHTRHGKGVVCVRARSHELMNGWSMRNTFLTKTNPFFIVGSRLRYNDLAGISLLAISLASNYFFVLFCWQLASVIPAFLIINTRLEYRPAVELLFWLCRSHSPERFVKKWIKAYIFDNRGIPVMLSSCYPWLLVTMGIETQRTKLNDSIFFCCLALEEAGVTSTVFQFVHSSSSTPPSLSSALQGEQMHPLLADSLFRHLWVVIGRTCQQKNKTELSVSFSFSWKSLQIIGKILLRNSPLTYLCY